MVAGVNLFLFAIYGLSYAAFVLLSAFRPSFMEVLLDGIPMAIVYGMGLIIGAFGVALFYCWFLREDRS